MKPDSNPSDSFGDMLTEAAAHLPLMAAQAAREHRSRRAWHRVRLTQAAIIALFGVCSWESFHWIHTGRDPDGLVQNAGRPTKRTGLGNYVTVQTKEESFSNPLPYPPEITQQQKELLNSSRGLPLLLVMDASDKPARIVVVER